MCDRIRGHVVTCPKWLQSWREVVWQINLCRADLQICNVSLPSSSNVVCIAWVVASKVLCAFSVSITCISCFSSRVCRPEVWWSVGGQRHDISRGQKSNTYTRVAVSLPSCLNLLHVHRSVGGVQSLPPRTAMPCACNTLLILQFLSHLSFNTWGKYTCNHRSVRVGNGRPS